MARFTDKSVERLRSTGKRRMLTEGENLYLEVSTKGKKKWLHRYELGGKRKWYTLGEYPGMDLKTAREENGKIAEKVKTGSDPAEAPTVGELFEEWFNRGADKRGKPWSPGHKRNVQYMFAADVIPAIGNKKVADISKREIRTLLRKIEKRAPNQALQVYRRLSRFFNFACQEDVIEVSPMANLEPIGRTSRKSRYLSCDEIRIFLAALPGANMAPQTARILELILRTGQRPSEVCGANQKEMQGEWWIIPPARTKNGLENRVFLTPNARRLFADPNEYGLYFPSLGDPEEPVKHTVLSKSLRRSIQGTEKHEGDTEKTIDLDPLSPHDLRRTCSTCLAELGFTEEIIGAVLNHSKRGVTGQHYNQYRYDIQKQQALEAWDRKIESIMTGATGKIVSFRSNMG